MPIEASVDVYGAKAVLTELNKIDKTQKFKAIAKMKAAGAPLIEAGRSQYPTDQPTDHWSPNGRLGYSKKKADSGVQLQIGGRSKGESYAIATLIQKTPGAAMFDIAGFANGQYSKGKSGDALIQKLNNDFGKAQRGLWRNIKTIREIGNKAILDALNEVASEFNRKVGS